MNYAVCGGDVGRDGYIVYDGYAQKRLYVGIVRLRFERIPQKNYCVYCAFRHARAYFEVAAPRSGEESFSLFSVAQAIISAFLWS